MFFHQSISTVKGCFVFSRPVKSFECAITKTQFKTKYKVVLAALAHVVSCNVTALVLSIQHMQFTQHMLSCYTLPEDAARDTSAWSPGCSVLGTASFSLGKRFCSYRKRDFNVSCHHSSVCKYQISVSLGCIIIQFLIVKTAV